MMNNLEITKIATKPNQIVKGAHACSKIGWKGYSGRNYQLDLERLSDFVLVGEDIYIIAHGGRSCWVGTANDLVNNGASRARFREALKIGDLVLRLKDDSDEITKMNIAWDIEGGRLSKIYKKQKSKLLS